MGMGRSGVLESVNVTSGGSGEGISPYKLQDSGRVGEEVPMGYELLNLNFRRKVLFMYMGFASRTTTSRSHCSKPSAVTSVMPGGRFPWI